MKTIPESKLLSFQHKNSINKFCSGINLFWKCHLL